MKKGKYRKAVFIVTYARVGKNVYYLILKRKLHWKGWEFPKGGVGFFEPKKRAIRREIREETGLDVLRMRRFRISGKYEYDKEYEDRKGFVGQRFLLYAVEVEKGKVKIDGLEHSDYQWLRFDEAKKKLKWGNQKKCLKVVDGVIRE